MSYIAGIYTNEDGTVTLKVYEGYFPQNPNNTDYRNYLARAEKEGKRVFTATASSRMNAQEAAADAGYLLDTQFHGFWTFVDYKLETGVMVYRERAAKQGHEKYKALYEQAEGRFLKVQALVEEERQAGVASLSIHVERASRGLHNAANEYIAYLEGYIEQTEKINERNNV